MYMIRNSPGLSPAASLREAGKLASSRRVSQRTWQPAVQIVFYRCGIAPGAFVSLKVSTADEGCGDLAVENLDFVLRHVLELGYAAREDFPSSRCLVTDFNLLLGGFFDRNPSIDLPPSGGSWNRVKRASNR
jgi:hypothetical protein